MDGLSIQFRPLAESRSAPHLLRDGCRRQARPSREAELLGGRKPRQSAGRALSERMPSHWMSPAHAERVTARAGDRLAAGESVTVPRLRERARWCAGPAGPRPVGGTYLPNVPWRSSEGSAGRDPRHEAVALLAALEGETAPHSPEQVELTRDFPVRRSCVAQRHLFGPILVSSGSKSGSGAASNPAGVGKVAGSNPVAPMITPVLRQ
jgi:hypothetical protein